jgi:predicted RNA-binding Zn-ribbon protein involved in translation (DUF1610 family)
MMRSGHCPRCGAQDIRQRQIIDQVSPGTEYVCLHCGYDEIHQLCSQVLEPPALHMLLASAVWRPVRNSMASECPKCGERVKVGQTHCRCGYLDPIEPVAIQRTEIHRSISSG